ncbi:unnamed protein product [Cyprideis torosa]|uniref:Uncharacterized protein n=1 Tax=Cyprideis torosa TaxID=163714 RepID=A0A7R8WE91_9CRUS|nr:unnamed protein product [Cyprideis torosa]CAG0890004.1 unnamed protein product [Cyprideis torosa]
MHHQSQYAITSVPKPFQSRTETYYVAYPTGAHADLRCPSCKTYRTDFAQTAYFSQLSEDYRMVWSPRWGDSNKAQNLCVCLSVPPPSPLPSPLPSSPPLRGGADRAKEAADGARKGADGVKEGAYRSLWSLIEPTEDWGPATDALEKEIMLTGQPQDEFLSKLEQIEAQSVRSMKLKEASALKAGPSVPREASSVEPRSEEVASTTL